MRLAVISDIHGNAVALEAVLADLQPGSFDQAVCLGDAIQGGPQPAAVVARLRALARPVVMGNADDWLLTGRDSGAEAISDARRQELDTVRAWQLTQLSPADLDFIAAFQPTLRLPLDDVRSLLCFHGSPRSFDEVILPQTPDEVAAGYLQPEPNTIYTGGHTHVQFIRHFGPAFHFNPGSAGFAYRHDQPEGLFRADPWAEYALLSSNAGRLSLEFRRVPYDTAPLIDAYRTSGRPFGDRAAAQYTG
ncbi:MAG: metallophosphoesterase family protein [Anaerolineales bacterium]